MDDKTVSPQDAWAKQQNGAMIIDIRQPDEFRREHLPSYCLKAGWLTGSAPV